MEFSKDKKALIDENIIGELESCMGDSFPMVVNAFFESSAKHMQSIKGCVSSDDIAYEQIADSAHALKSISAQIGASETAKISGQLEEVALEAGISGGDKKKVRALYDILADQFPELYKLLEAKL